MPKRIEPRLPSHADFTDRPGFTRPGAFYQHRTSAIEAGFLIVASAASNSQTGRKPDLFTIAPKWLHQTANLQIDS